MNTLFDAVVGRPATLNYVGCKNIGVVKEVVWLSGELNYHIQFPDTYKTKSGRIKNYFWSAIYPEDYVIIKD